MLSSIRILFLASIVLLLYPVWLITDHVQIGNPGQSPYPCASSSYFEAVFIGGTMEIAHQTVELTNPGLSNHDKTPLEPFEDQSDA